jgi:peptide subunit release factor 1 (eRF1)
MEDASCIKKGLILEAVPLCSFQLHSLSLIRREVVMTTQSPVNANSETLKSLLPLVHSQELFLSAYLDTTRSEYSARSARLRLASLLDKVATQLEDTALEKPFEVEREVVESYLDNLGPGSDGLLILSASVGAHWHALWLPGQPPKERARFGRGAFALPIMELLDEWEPVGFVGISKDKARLLAVSVGRIQEARRLESSVPGRHKAVGGSAAYRGPGGSKREQGGGAGLRHERHIDVHTEGHFKSVIDELTAMHQTHPFRRLFIGGPTEAITKFKDALPRVFSDMVAGEISVAGYASDHDVLSKIRDDARRVEREQEELLAQDLIDRAEKDGNAVAGAGPSAWALNRRQVHLLVMNADSDIQGRHCLSCDLLLPPEDARCPQCGQKTRPIDLLEEAPNALVGHGVGLELVHGQAVERLRGYDGIGAVLKTPTR